MLKQPTRAIRALLHRFLGDECGASAIEYALIASGVSIVIAATVAGLGSNIKGMYTSVSTALK